MVDLRVTLGRITLQNPVLVASGTFGYVRELAGFVHLRRLGGVIPKTVTFHPRAGNATPRTVETASGLLNAIGLDNDGIHHFCEHHLPYLRSVGTAVIANIAGEDEDQFVTMAEMLGDEAGLTALELNISCPNVSHGLDLGVDARAVERLVRRVRAACSLPIIAKLTPNVTDVVPIAAAAAEGGADAVSLINTLKGMAVDWRRRVPILANDIGGLSGPAIKPIALRMVWEVAQALPGYPLIGIGGIASATDALEFLVAGATALQIGTATFYNPRAAETVLDQLPEILAESGITEIRQIIGSLRSNRQNPSHPSLAGDPVHRIYLEVQDRN
jgi:dihydroorotate dehydrogenase (NAD+) catalytic subunit